MNKIYVDESVCVQICFKFRLFEDMIAKIVLRKGIEVTTSN